MKTTRSLFIVSALITLAVSASTEFSVAQDSAPPVVAPAQPAQAATTVATGAAPVMGAPAQQGSPWVTFGMMGLMFVVMYFLMIRPQQKRQKEHQNLLSNLKSGDQVMLNSGILGNIAGMSEKVVTLEIAKGVQIKVLKSQVNQIVKGDGVSEIQA